MTHLEKRQKQIEADAMNLLKNRMFKRHDQVVNVLDGRVGTVNRQRVHNGKILVTVNMIKKNNTPNGGHDIVYKKFGGQDFIGDPQDHWRHATSEEFSAAENAVMGKKKQDSFFKV